MNDDEISMSTLVNSIVILKPIYYHYSGFSIEKFWHSDCGWSICADIVQGLLDGTLSDEQLREMEDEMICDAECEALWNYVHIAPIINLETEISKVNALLLEDITDIFKPTHKTQWRHVPLVDPRDLFKCHYRHNIDDVISAYCYYIIGAYQIFSFQIDDVSSYTCMSED